MRRCATATDAYERFRLNDAAAAVYHFLWSDLADWYIEQIKPRLYGDQPGGDVARAVAAADLRRRACGCCTRSCRSSPRRSGSGFPGGRPRPRSRWHPGPRADDRASDADGTARLRPGAGTGRCRPDDPRRVRDPAGPAGAGGSRRSAVSIAGASARAATITRLAKVSDLRSGRAGARRRPRRAVGRHRGLRPAGRRDRRRAGVRPAGRRGGPARPAGGIAGEEARQRAVRLAGTGRCRGPRARKARDVARSARGAGRGSGRPLGCG